MELSLARLGESLLDEAIENGSLTPPPAGTHLNLEPYFQTPEAWRPAFSMLKGGGFVPPEVDCLREAASLEDTLQKTSDEAERRRLRNQIDHLRVRYRLAIERLT